MGAATNIVVNDGATPAVAHTFTPVNRDSNGFMVFVDQSAETPAGYHRATLRLREPAPGSNDYKFEMKVWRRTLEVTSPSTSTGIQPAPTLAYSQIGGVEFSLPRRGTEAERKDVHAFIVNILASPQVKDMVTKLIGIY